ncbi:MAG: hypothetical protein WC249_01160 [Patescibacteria group bacterium]|jgi:hypothetical protein
MKTIKLFFVLIAIVLLTGCQKNESVVAPESELQPIILEDVYYTGSFKYDQTTDKTQLQLYYLGKLGDKFIFDGYFTGNLLRQTKDNVYIGASAAMGGYILYGKYTVIYKYTRANHSLITLSENDATDVDFDSKLEFMVYSRDKFLVIKRLVDTSEQVFTPTWAQDNSQMGDFKFSPDGKKIAIAVGWGPDNEHGAIYTLDLITNKFQLVKETSGIPQVIGWGLYK